MTIFEQHRKSKSIKYLSWKDLNFIISPRNLNPVSYCTYTEVYIHVINNLSSMWNDTYLGDIVDWSFICALSEYTEVHSADRKLSSIWNALCTLVLWFLFPQRLVHCCFILWCWSFPIHFQVSAIFDLSHIQYFCLFCLNQATENNLWTLHLLNPLFCPPPSNKKEKKRQMHWLQLTRVFSTH